VELMVGFTRPDGPNVRRTPIVVESVKMAGGDLALSGILAPVLAMTHGFSMTSHSSGQLTPLLASTCPH
jgi:hypothetical protein